MAHAAAAHLPGDHRPVAAFLRRQPVHLHHGLGARRPGAVRGRLGHARSGTLRRPAAPGAGPDRDRDRLRDDGAAPRGAARSARPHRDRSCRRAYGAGRMSGLAEHLLIAPIAVPLAAAALMLLFDERRHVLKAFISLAASLLLLAAALALVMLAERSVTSVYPLGSWPAPFGIVLVADRLSALMVLLAAALALAALVFSLARWHRAGPHFHSLVQFLLAGLNGAFLTGDLFNLFVFFELLLAASYGLALHGSGLPRVRASLHYIVVNLAASLLFLIGVSLMYGVTGTLNMADLAMRVPALPRADLVLVEIGAAALGIAFLVKAGMWPLCFWLPSTYAAAAAPAAAVFSIMTKVGVYAVLRLWLLLFGGEAGAELLVYGGMATLFFGLVGMLSSQELGRIGGFSLLVSSGTLLAAIGHGGDAVTGAALYYLVISTLGIAAFFLLIELVERMREPGADMLALTAEAFGLAGEEAEEEPEEEVGVVIPATMALLGLAFACSALVIAGLPPLPEIGRASCRE